VNSKDISKLNAEWPEADDLFESNERPKADDPFALNERPKVDDPFALNEESDFSFDYPEPKDLVNADNEIMDLSEPVRLLSCICPKCTEKTDIDLAQVEEDGFVITCSFCNKKIQIIRESSACRAKRRSYEINCANCGKQLDQHAHCSSCGKLYPDYFVAINPDDARIKARNEFFRNKWAAIRSLNFSFKNISYGSSQDSTRAYSPERAAFALASETAGLRSRKNVIIALLLVVAVALVVTGTFAYNSYKSGQVYAENYIKTLYCIKTGVDSNLQTCASMRAEWESLSVSGRSFSPRINDKDEAISIKLKGEVDKYLQMLAAPPAKYEQANESLMKIHKIYLDSDTLMFSKPNTLQEFSNSIDNITKKMNQASQELKSNLPDAIKEELANAKLKYRGLKDF
jgi:hypothetical protein